MARAEGATAAEPLAVTREGLRLGLQTALDRLYEQRGRINDLNVFPVPDGDTGNNMHLTLEAAMDEVSQLPRTAAVPDVAKAAAHGSLMGARGNSGVILSQVLRGFCLGCGENETLNPAALGAALQRASEVAYSAVKRPVEGTILTVVRDTATAAANSAGHGNDLREVADAAVSEAWAAVERTRDQLEALREAGVVDAGGFGLAVILTALSEVINGTQVWPAQLAPESDGETHERGIARTAAPEGGFGYCTEFSLVDSQLSPDELRERLLPTTSEDDSSLVVGDRGLLHVHVHLKQPWEVLPRAAELGRIERLKVEDMTAQHHLARHSGGSRAPARTSKGLAPVAVAAVAQRFGFRQLLLGLGAASVLDGGPTMNSSTDDLLRAVQDARAKGVLLLPNHRNLVLTAEQAARVSPCEVAVVPSTNLPQGVAALLAFDAESTMEVNRRRMEAATTEVRAVEVTRASRPSRLGDRPIAKGEFIALTDGELTAAGPELAQVVLSALAELDQTRLEVVTLYQGAGVETAEASELERRIRRQFPDLEVERHDGGQQLYPFIISAE